MKIKKVITMNKGEWVNICKRFGWINEVYKKKKRKKNNN